MEIREFGTWGYQVGAVGIIAFTVCFLVSVRWWTDWLGRVIAAVLTTTSGVLIITTLRQMYPNLNGGQFWTARAIVYWAFGIAVWSSWLTFLWAQFIAPRIRRTTPPKQEERERV